MAVTESILDSIKLLLGISADDTTFDTDVIIHINTVMADLYQLGIGPPEGFTIQDKNSKWSDLLGADKRLESVKTYVYIEVKLVFDPPQSSALIESLKRTSDKLAFRISVAPEMITLDGEEG
jgi:hypothetical protein